MSQLRFATLPRKSSALHTQDVVREFYDISLAMAAHKILRFCERCQNDLPRSFFFFKNVERAAGTTATRAPVSRDISCGPDCTRVPPRQERA